MNFSNKNTANSTESSPEAQALSTFCVWLCLRWIGISLKVIFLVGKKSQTSFSNITVFQTLGYLELLILRILSLRLFAPKRFRLWSSKIMVSRKLGTKNSSKSTMNTTMIGSFDLLPAYYGKKQNLPFFSTPICFIVSVFIRFFFFPPCETEPQKNNRVMCFQPELHQSSFWSTSGS